jgi:transcriptional regulator with XRE-family HTH domain
LTVLAMQQATARHAQSEGVISGAVIREVRRGLNLTQEPMAQQLFIDVDTYRSWENARRPLTRLPLHRFKALTRGLLDIGVSGDRVALLDVAVEVDLALGRSLSSEENPFPLTARCELWHELLAWAVLGTTPALFADNGVVGTPRMAAVDRNTILRRIRYAVDKPDGTLTDDTLQLIGRVYLGIPPCPAWCINHDRGDETSVFHQLDRGQAWGGRGENSGDPILNLGLVQNDDASSPGEPQVDVMFSKDGFARVCGAWDESVYMPLDEAQSFVDAMQDLIDQAKAAVR